MKTFQERLDRWMGPAFQRPADPARVPPGVSRREVQARKALRWYAPSWREAHGEELVTTVLDASAPTSGDVDDGLKWSTRVELACSGLQQRHRYRPSWQVRSRLLHGTPPASWDELGWLRDTLDQRGQLLRQEMFLVCYPLAWFASNLVLFGTGFLPYSIVGFTTLLLVATLRVAFSRSIRWSAIRQRGSHPMGLATVLEPAATGNLGVSCGTSFVADPMGRGRTSPGPRGLSARQHGFSRHRVPLPGGQTVVHPQWRSEASCRRGVVRARRRGHRLGRRAPSPSTPASRSSATVDRDIAPGSAEPHSARHSRGRHRPGGDRDRGAPDAAFRVGVRRTRAGGTAGRVRAAPHHPEGRTRNRRRGASAPDRAVPGPRRSLAGNSPRRSI